MNHNKKHKQGKQKPAKPVLEPLSADLGDGDSKFSRALGSTDYLTREQGLTALSRWLTTRTDVSDLEMLRLWKGLYFCFWHSDKVPVQTDLAERLAGLMLQMKPAVAHAYWSAFLATLRREWFNMDNHRVNKFLMLVRKFVNAMFGALKRSNWSPATIALMTQQLRCGAQLLPLSEHRSAGLTYHLADVWLAELHKVAGGQPLPAEAAAALLAVPLEAVAGSAVQAQVDRVRDSVFEELLQLLRRPGSQEEEEEEDQEAAQAAAAWGELSLEQLAAELFERASQPQVRARNREALYALHADLERLSGKKRKLGPGQAAAAGGGAGAARAAAAQPQPQQQKQALKPQQQKRGAASPAPAAAAAGGEDAAAGSVPASSKKRKKQHGQEEGQIVLEQQQQQTPVPAAKAEAAALPSSSKKKKRKHGSMAAGEEADAATTPSAAAAAAALPATPASAKQSRKQQPQQQQAGGASPKTPAAAAPGRKGGEPLQNLSGALNKQGKPAAAAAAKGSLSAPPKLKAGANGNLAVGPAAAGTPGAAAAAVTPVTRGATSAAAAAGAAAATTGKKAKKAGVRINLRQNLYFEHGAPPPAADVRTPPAAKPKGSALKKGGGTALNFPLSAPPGNSKKGAAAGSSGGSSGGKTQRRVVSPASVPRPRAAAFF